MSESDFDRVLARAVIAICILAGLCGAALALVVTRHITASVVCFALALVGKWGFLWWLHSLTAEDRPA